MVGFIPESLKYVCRSHDFKATSSVLPPLSPSRRSCIFTLFGGFRCLGSLAGHGGNQEGRYRTDHNDLIFSCWHQDVGNHQYNTNLMINSLSTVRAVSAIWWKKCEEQQAAGSDDKCMERFTISHSCLKRVGSL